LFWVFLVVDKVKLEDFISRWITVLVSFAPDFDLEGFREVVWLFG